MSDLMKLKEIERDKREAYNSLKNHLNIILGFAPYRIREPLIQEQIKDFKQLGKELSELLLIISIKEKKAEKGIQNEK